MKRWIQFAVALLVTVAFVAPADAKKCEGVSMPDSQTVAGEKLVLNGMGVREATIFSVNVYVAGIYVKEKSKDGGKLAAADSPKRLSMEFVRDVEKSKIVDAYRESFKKAAGSKYKANKAKLKELLGWMESVKSGEKHIYTYVPDKGLTVKVEGNEKGTIEGADFAEAFFLIWLGDNPPNEGLKTGLLGGACG